jgi:uncharacterized membrane protein YfcA
VPLGVGVGAFGTIVGAGGGFILVPVLLLLYPGKQPETITSMSLLVVWANAVSGSLAYARQGRIDYRSGLVFAAATLPGAVAGAVLVSFIPRRAFDLIFAGLLVVLGLWLMLRRTNTAIQPPLTGRGVVHRMIRDRQGNTFVYSFPLWRGVFISLVVGFVSSLLGIGGGIIHVPAMATTLHFPVHIATATSHFVLAWMAGEGTVVHLVSGDLGWSRSLLQAVLVGAGAIPGAQVGALLSHRVRSATILRALAAALIAVGIRLALAAF